MRTIYTNIAQLCGITHGELRKAGQEMARVEMMADAWLAVEDDKILDFGTGSVPAELMQDAKVIDTKGAFVMPRFCDSHTHLVWAGSREQEFEDKLQGLSYAEIAPAAVASSILPTVSTIRARRTFSSRPCAVPRKSGRKAQDVWKSSLATD